MPDVIICANFGLEKLRGFGYTGGQIFGSPIEMAGHPYNSAALPRILWCPKPPLSPSHTGTVLLVISALIAADNTRGVGERYLSSAAYACY